MIFLEQQSQCYKTQRIQSKTHNRKFSNLYYHYIMPNLETNIIPGKYTLFYPPNVAAIIWVKCSFYVRNNHPQVVVLHQSSRDQVYITCDQQTIICLKPCFTNILLLLEYRAILIRIKVSSLFIYYSPGSCYAVQSQNRIINTVMHFIFWRIC